MEREPTAYFMILHIVQAARTLLGFHHPHTYATLCTPLPSIVRASSSTGASTAYPPAVELPFYPAFCRSKAGKHMNAFPGSNVNRDRAVATVTYPNILELLELIGSRTLKIDHRVAV